MIRIGRCKYGISGNISYPSFPDFLPIVVMMRGHGKYSVLSPYYLKTQEGYIMENLWQFSKVYQTVPKTTQRYSRWNNEIIWEHPREEHYRENQLLPAYWAWREKGMHAEHAIRYPIGYANKHKCLFAIENETHNEHLDYITARMKIYIPVYCNLVRNEEKFNELKQMLTNGQNLLIIEVDGPHHETLTYYREKYHVGENFIEADTMIATEENLFIMMCDEKHPFGHGYCLAMALLDMDHLAELVNV